MNGNCSTTGRNSPERLPDTVQLEHQWKSIDWKKAEAEVSRLQARIAKATQEKKWNTVKRLQYLVPFPVSWTVKMKKKQKETQDILSYHTQAAGCSDKARAKASGGRQPIEECGRTGL